jgi:hypothetical protein
MQRNENVNHRRREKKVTIIKRGSSAAVVEDITTLEIDGGNAFNSGTAYIGVDGGGA